MVVGSLRLDEHADAGDAHDAARLAIAWMASSLLQRGWPFTSARQLEWVISTGLLVTSNASSVVRSPQCETSTAMPTLFMRCDDRDAKIREAVVSALGGAVADHVAGVIGQLGYPLAQRMEEIDVVGRAEVLGILDAEQDADLLARLDAVQHRGAESIRISAVVVMREKAVPESEKAKDIRIARRLRRSDRDVEDGDAGIPEPLQIGGREIGRPLHPGRTSAESLNGLSMSMTVVHATRSTARFE